MSVIVNNTIKTAGNRAVFKTELQNAKRYNSFTLDQKTYFPKNNAEWRNNTTQLYRDILAAMAEKDFDRLYKAEREGRNNDQPNIVSEEELQEIGKKSAQAKNYYDNDPFYTKDGVAYCLHTRKRASAFMSRVWTYAEKLNWFIEVSYEPGEEKKSEENKDVTDSSGEDQETNGTETKLEQLISKGRKRQIILTGAPGTGKTYTAKKLAKSFIEQGNYFYTYYRGKDKDEKEIEKAVTELLSDTAYRAGDCGDAAVLGEDYKAFDAAYIEKVCQKIGLDGYGKEAFWKEVERLRGRLAFVQFHPSYDYTDFVEGLRPVEKNTDEKSEMHFKRLDGSFMSFCRFVAWQNERIPNNLNNLYFFVIDEINRADLSKVLGELMFCLEEDKRGKGNRVFTQYKNIDTYFPGLMEKTYYQECFRTGFFIPENVVIIGTMNDIDRSVTSMDFALRRRFVWEEVEVTEELLSAAFSGNERFGVLNEREGVRSDVISRTLKFNTYKCEKVRRLNKDFDISQGQFINLSKDELDLSEEDLKDDKKTADAVMGWVWKYRIRSLMKEYLRGETNADGLLIDFEKAWLQKETQ